MSQQQDLTMELVSLFDLKKSKMRSEKNLTQAAYEAQRDIRYLTMMFCDGIPDITMMVNENEGIRWDSHANVLLYINGQQVQILEAAPREIRVRMRPYLFDLIKKAREFYK